MQGPRKRNSEILTHLDKEKNIFETARTRTSMLIAAKIIAAMKQKGLNKITFAQEVGKKPSVITRWVSGTHNFTTDTLSDIQIVLGISLMNLEALSSNNNNSNFIEGKRSQTFRIGKEQSGEKTIEDTTFETAKVVSINRNRRVNTNSKESTVKAS